jgi:hypothetical protein
MNRLFKNVCVCGTFLGIAYGLLAAIVVHQPNWLDQPDYMYRCAVISVAAFALIGLSLLSIVGEKDYET